jgi:hypothetical protein
MEKVFYDWEEGRDFYAEIYMRDSDPYFLQHGALFLAKRKRYAEAFRWIDRALTQTFPGPEKWTWPVVSEIMLARLEGSRRALRGTRFESLVRRLLSELFVEKNIALTVSNKQIVLSDETYDVQVISRKSKILIPVKTRETMGGGHANLFTRDIFKSVSVAQENGYLCIPVVIAESWGGDLKSLKCEHLVYIQANPNQADQVAPKLASEFEALLPVWKEFSEDK